MNGTIQRTEAEIKQVVADCGPYFAAVVGHVYSLCRFGTSPANGALPGWYLRLLPLYSFSADSKESCSA